MPQLVRTNKQLFFPGDRCINMDKFLTKAAVVISSDGSKGFKKNINLFLPGNFKRIPAIVFLHRDSTRSLIENIRCDCLLAETICLFCYLFV